MSINAKMTAIANAIREKTGKTEALSLDKMAEAVSSIKIGRQKEPIVLEVIKQKASPIVGETTYKDEKFIALDTERQNQSEH